MTLNSFKSFYPDLVGGITAAVVALPLALAFGVSSGAGAIAGIYSAIIVGFFASIFGGTTRQISGPTGPMTVVVATIISSFQNSHPESALSLVFTVIILAGLLQIIMGLLRLGRFIVLVPYVVVSGFMSGIGLIIIILQLDPLLGLPTQSSVLQSLQSLNAHWDDIVAPSVYLGTLSLAITFLWPKRWKNTIPSSLAAFFIGTLAFLWLFSDNALITTIGTLPSGLPSLHFPATNRDVLFEIFYSAMLLALLGAIDSLLTSLVADRMTRTQHDSDKELIGQGIGNMFSGFLGGLPGAGATMRTVVNINAGSKTKLAGVIHSATLLILVLGAAPLTANIPHAVLAGILIKVGLEIIDWSFIRRLRQMPLSAIAIVTGVALITIFYDLIMAVLLGSFVANLIAIDKLTRTQKQKIKLITNLSEQSAIPDELQKKILQCDINIFLLDIKGAVTFGASSSINQLGNLKKSECGHIIIDLSDAQLLSLTVALQLKESITQLQEHKINVLIIGLQNQTKTYQKIIGTKPNNNTAQPAADLNTAIALCLENKI